MNALVEADTPLLGHAPAWAEWRAAIASGRPHHAWLLAGPHGIGKGLFARAAAAELVASSTMPQLAWDRHPDILLLDHLPATDADEAKRAEGKEYQTKRSISVDQIRHMQQRLITRPTLGERRAIVIDPADDLEKSAANALLKSLEEPPTGTFFLLVAHRPGALPPTIRSRCRILRFAPLSDGELVKLLQSSDDADESTRTAAISIAGGSPGVAQQFIREALGSIFDLMLAILRDGDARLTLRGRLAEGLGARPGRLRIAAILDLACAVIARELPKAGRERQPRIIDAHSALVRLAAQAPTYNFDPGLLAVEIGGLLASAAMPRASAPLL